MCCTLAFPLQLRKKHGKTSFRVKKFDYFIYYESFLIFHDLFKQSCKTHYTEEQIVGQNSEQRECPLQTLEEVLHETGQVLNYHMLIIQAFLNTSLRSACFIDEGLFSGKKLNFQCWDYSPYY